MGNVESCGGCTFTCNGAAPDENLSMSAGQGGSHDGGQTRPQKRPTAQQEVAAALQEAGLTGPGASQKMSRSRQGPVEITAPNDNNHTPHVLIGGDLGRKQSGYTQGLIPNPTVK